MMAAYIKEKTYIKNIQEAINKINLVSLNIFNTNS